MFAPNSIIEKLLQMKKSQAALVFDALFASDLAAWKSFDFSTILHYFRLSGIEVGEAVIRRGLFDLARLGLLATRKIMNRAKGRPAWEYRLGTISGIAEILGVKLHRNENADSVPRAAFKSVRAYRAGKHYSFLKRLGTSYLSRKKLGARLGVGGRSTYNYELGTDVKVSHRLDRKELKMLDVPFAPTKRMNANIFLEVEFERNMTDDEMREVYKDFDESYLLIGNRKRIDRRFMPYTRFILARELTRGNRVFLVKQITNEYKIDS